MMMSSLLVLMISALHISENLTIYPVVPPEAEQGWKLELFELGEAIQPHYHKIQRQLILVTEGELQAFYGNEKPITLHSGELIYVDPGIIHSLIPKETARFFSIDLPGFKFPEDVYHDVPMTTPKWDPSDSEPLPLLDPKFFGSRIDAGEYGVYELIPGNKTGGKWSSALLDIDDSPKHFHRIEREIFVVVNGELDIEIDGIHHILAKGEFVVIHPGRVHRLKSAKSYPVRILCFNFPAFDPKDHYLVE